MNYFPSFFGNIGKSNSKLYAHPDTHVPNQLSCSLGLHGELLNQLKGYYLSTNMSMTCYQTLTDKTSTATEIKQM